MIITLLALEYLYEHGSRKSIDYWSRFGWPFLQGLCRLLDRAAKERFLLSHLGYKSKYHD